MNLRTLRPIGLLALALGFFTPQAQAQEPIIQEILVSVQDTNSKAIIAELRDGDTLRLRPGDRVRLRLVAVPQNQNRSRHYPEGSYELQNPAGSVSLDNNPERGSAVVTAHRQPNRNVTPLIRYVVTRKMRMDQRLYRGTLYVSVENNATVQPTPQPPVVQPPRPEDLPGITLFEHQDFRGRSETFYTDDNRLNDNSGVRQDMASSVRVDPGCRVVLYEHPDYDGRAAVLTEDEVDLSRTRVGNDSVSSLEVRCDSRR